ncbi:MAG: hypothetical protein KDB07_03995 [Planctomycetes bacterium]|nr:hypothetical protein [Planctomycetota bacterium]
MSTKTATGSVPNKQAMRRIRKQLSDAVQFVRSREVTAAIASVSFNELIALQIRTLVGDDTDTLRSTETLYDGGKEVKVAVRRARVYGRYVITQRDRIDAMENTIESLVNGIKNIDPAAFVSAYEDKTRRTLKE